MISKVRLGWEVKEVSVIASSDEMGFSICYNERLGLLLTWSQNCLTIICRLYAT